MERNSDGEILEDGDTCPKCGQILKEGVSGNSNQGTTIIKGCNC